jgi:hypothetical protein
MKRDQHNLSRSVIDGCDQSLEGSAAFATNTFVLTVLVDRGGSGKGLCPTFSFI